MEWHNTNECPDKYVTIVLLCENGKIYFEGMFDEEYEVWDYENEVNKAPKEKVVGWMYQSVVKNYLRGLKMGED